MFQFTNIPAYQKALSTGEVTCVQAVRYYLDRIKERVNINAYAHVFGEEAISRAEELDAKRNEGKPVGKLHGIVISIKDVFSYAGHPLTASSKMLSGFEALFNATAVQRILDEDAIIIGSCNCDEFAMGSTGERSIYGNVKNPVNLSKVAGGSSSGSAAAVAADLCMISLGSDTGGSVRQPADFCGVVGYKPSYGRVSRYGVLAYASSFDTVGIIAKNITDIEPVLDVISGPDGLDSTARTDALFTREDPAREEDFKWAVLRKALSHPSLDGEIRDSIVNLVEQLRGEGVNFEEEDIGLMDYLTSIYYVISSAEVTSNMARYDSIRYGYRTTKPIENLEDLYKISRSEGFSREVKKRILLGNYLLSEGNYDTYLVQAQKIRQKLIDEVNGLFTRHDFLILPTTLSTAYDLGSAQKGDTSRYTADIFTVIANLTGHPAISLPLFRHSNGMPFSLQIIAAKDNEINLLKAAENLMNRFHRL
ncbi:MAG: Asp-tRNA(Asn)/Glu-tRNA(Gln) amidotransferase subunit GatA [Chitinophagaceae bacterium]|nr:Asp-tRNA(Asn)/Glu-tRNA(Gln) amidotransferase subunit GatA [Chitinophagaceae bacterium]